MSEEIWKDIKGYEGLYQVSNLGRIKGLERRCKTRWYTRKVPEKIYSPAIDTYGYPIVSLHKDGKKKTITIHKLVANAFLEKPDGVRIRKDKRVAAAGKSSRALFKKTMHTGRE